MSRFTAQSTARRTFVTLREPTETVNARMAGLNAAPLVKGANALDTTCFALDGIGADTNDVVTVEFRGVSYEMPLGAAVLALGQQFTTEPLTTRVPAAMMDSEAAIELQKWVSKAQSNEKSAWSAKAGALTIVEVEA